MCLSVLPTCFPSFLPSSVPPLFPPPPTAILGLAVGLEVNRSPLTTAEHWVRSQDIPSEIFCDCSGTGTDISPNTLRFPPSLSFHSTPESKSPICHWCCMLLAVHSVVTMNAFNFIPNEWLKREREDATAVCLNDSTGSTVVCADYALLLYIKTSL
jgi:hypothetical protein